LYFVGHPRNSAAGAPVVDLCAVRRVAVQEYRLGGVYHVASYLAIVFLDEVSHY